MSASMAAVLAEHMPTTSSMSSNRGEGGGSHGRSCSCGVSVTVEYAELGDEETSTTPLLNAKLAAHVASVLAADGYGKLEDAWDEGQKSGMRHADRVIAAHKIGRPELPGPPSPNPYRETGADGADAVTGFPRAAYQKRRMG